ncbi:RHS repeat-associated core domain-containing protein [Streptomyces hainanensis]|uniref:Rhs protein n=1 Tax=Streptomyces hainanensis TaxID=402648 RepID=A0A4R4TJE3_9ACTN|nr:RHS repeat-associated core domain-containing protein [Streptomyces hainanensis]TDC74279.1 hypothetical protein E1283_16230 [Streptomyces hainanensis]
MVRPSDWSPVDMDSDPTPGNPDEVRELADELQTFADDVGEALGRVRGMSEDRAMLDWAGLSAEAFRSEFDGVPGNLEKLETSYGMAARALQTYWPKLETAQGMADRALDRAITAQADLSSAQSALTDAQDWVSRAGDEADRLEREGERENVEPPSEADVRAATRDATAAGQAASDAQGQVDSAEEALSAARELARQAKEMREDAAGACASSIDEASDAGIQNRRWWEDAINWVSENWDTIVEICKVVVAVLGIVVLIIGGPLAWVVLAAALVVLADTLYRYANGEASLWDVAFAALDCIPGMKGLTTLGGLARGMRGGLSAARTGLRSYAGNLRNLGRMWRAEGVRGAGKVLVGDPIDIATGEMTLRATDVELPGVLPLTIEREHLSNHRHGRWFGISWASTLDQRLVLTEHGVDFYADDGMRLHYPVPLSDPDVPVLPVEGPRWGLSWDGRAGGGMSVRQPETGRTLRFVGVPGRAGNELSLVTVSDRNANRVDLHYNDAGEPAEITHSGGYRIGVAVDAGRIVSLTLLSAPEQPVLVRYGYDDAGNLAEVYNSSGLPLRFAYDADARMIRWEDRNDTWYRYEYDAAGRCVFTTGTDRVLEYRYHYDVENNRTTAVNSLGHATVYQLNDRFQLVAETDPLGHTTHREWDSFHRLTSLTDPLGNTTRTEHDDDGNVTLVTRPDGSRVRTEYNALGLPSETTQPDGATWHFAYDARGNRVAVLDPAGERWRFTYDGRGAPLSVTDPLGHTTRYRNDAAGMVVAVTSPLGETTRWERDAFGRVVLSVDAAGAAHRYAHTPEGRPLHHVNPLGAERSWSWDGEGNLLTHTDENGGVTSFAYGAFDAPTHHVAPDGSRVGYERDTELRLVKVTNPLGLAWEYAYDAAGRLARQTDFDGRTLDYARDAAGQLVSRTNALGATVSFTYDRLGRLTGKHGAGLSDCRFGYDPLGRLVTADNDDTRVVMERDALGRAWRETTDDRVLTQSFDALGRPLVRTSPAGHTSVWGYDDAGRAASLVTAGRTIAFERDALGRETARRVGDAISLNWSWDAMHRPTEQGIRTGVGLHRRRAYDYRADAYPTDVTDQDGTRTRYHLDPVGRVTAVDGGPGRRERYTYNAAGDQIHASWPETLLPDAEGDRSVTGTRVLGAGRIGYEYDAAGRVTVRRRTRLSRKPDIWRYAWDAEDQLTSVTTPDGTVWRYRYDAVGRRVAKQRLAADGSVAEETLFVWQDTTLVEQLTTGADGAGTSTTWDVSGGHPLAQTECVGPTGPRGGQEEIDSRFYAIVTDLVGTPSELVAEDGELAWQADRTLWGAVRARDDSTVDVPLRFPGQYADEETGWHYNVHRHYDPAVGRFTSPDPLGLAPALHHYTYPHNPLAWTDPVGLAAHPPLTLIHRDSFDPGSVNHWRNQPTAAIVESLRPGAREALRVWPDGRVANGNTRVSELLSRGYDVDSLPREPYGRGPMTDEDMWSMPQ